MCVCVRGRVFYLQSVCLVLPTHGESWAVAGLQNPSRRFGLERDGEVGTGRKEGRGKYRKKEKEIGLGKETIEWHSFGQ